MRTCFRSICFLLLLLPAVAMAQPAARRADSKVAPKNVILMISDGCGPAAITMARDYLRDALRQGDHLALDGVQTGGVRTYSDDSRVTDSAAGATAYACGIKTRNGWLAVDTLGRPVATLLEAAEARGMATGLVATSRITHATPAAFSSHIADRGDEAEIAAQQITKGIDVLLGGGLAYYQGGTRKDGRDLLAEARADGYQVLGSLADLRGKLRTPVIGLFASDHLPYDIDRDTLAIPSLAEMTRRALALLAPDPDGFFLMVEGSRIDHAAHGNDPATMVREVLAYDQAVVAALDFARRDGHTLVISVSDHETGGLTLGRDGVYAWNPEVLMRPGASIEALTASLGRAARPDSLMAAALGLADLSADERAQVQQATGNAGALARLASTFISRRALIGWTSGAHTAVDVNLYAFGPGRSRFVGNYENTAVGQMIAELLGFNLSAQTGALRAAR